VNNVPASSPEDALPLTEDARVALDLAVQMWRGSLIDSILRERANASDVAKPISAYDVRVAATRLGIDIEENKERRIEAAKERRATSLIAATSAALTLLLVFFVFQVGGFEAPDIGVLKRWDWLFTVGALGLSIAAAGLAARQALLASRNAQETAAAAELFAGNGAFLAKWGELESAMRKVASQADEPIRAIPLRQLLEDYAAKIDLAEGDLREILRLLHIRNNIAHGQPVDAEEVVGSLESINRQIAKALSAD
jgi:hypothetical protein